MRRSRQDLTCLKVVIGILTALLIVGVPVLMVIAALILTGSLD